VSKRCLFAWAWCIGVVLALPAAADVRTCNGALTSAGLCQAPTDALLYYPIPEAAQPDFIDAWGELANYQADVPCGSERLVDDAGIVIQAGPGESTCTAGTAGELVANPQPKARAVDRFIRAQLVGVVREYRARQAEAAARETVEAEPDPEIP
jgi:hypothetical protein